MLFKQPWANNDILIWNEQPTREEQNITSGACAAYHFVSDGDNFSVGVISVFFGPVIYMKIVRNFVASAFPV